MKAKFRLTLSILFVLVFMTLSCGIFGTASNGNAPLEAETEKLLLRQWASTAQASSEYGNPDWSAGQATGAPDTLECGDTPTAWAAYHPDTVEWLEVGFATPVTPIEINIYESFSPSQIVHVEILDTQGTYHEAYSAEPKATACPSTLTISVPGADYRATKVKITVDQSRLGLSWDEIDAVELVGYADKTETEPPQEAESQPVDHSGFELPVANPSQEHSFHLEYSGCDEGEETGNNIEVFVHDDRIDLRMWGTHGKYILLTLPRNLNNNYSDRLVEFALEGRVPPSAGLYIQSAWWYGEKGKVETYYNADNSLSGFVEFEGTRKSGCVFTVRTEFEHVALRR